MLEKSRVSAQAPSLPLPCLSVIYFWQPSFLSLSLSHLPFFLWEKGPSEKKEKKDARKKVSSVLIAIWHSVREGPSIPSIVLTEGQEASFIRNEALIYDHGRERKRKRMGAIKQKHNTHL